jgi:hypothetical protein
VAGVVVGEDVGLEEDLGGGAVDRRLEGRKELGAVLEQVRALPRSQVMPIGSGAAQAVRAAWSEMRLHGGP